MRPQRPRRSWVRSSPSCRRTSPRRRARRSLGPLSGGAPAKHPPSPPPTCACRARRATPRRWAIGWARSQRSHRSCRTSTASSRSSSSLSTARPPPPWSSSRCTQTRRRRPTPSRPSSNWSPRPRRRGSSRGRSMCRRAPSTLTAAEERAARAGRERACRRLQRVLRWRWAVDRIAGPGAARPSRMREAFCAWGSSRRREVEDAEA
mmetsp:Transcript_8239/g.21707  ORF Transcript_8239/g.21707 Transcript_8239/m.21707 type:complete len:206 (+) Transcript_8239:1088-1705(+)